MYCLYFLLPTLGRLQHVLLLTTKISHERATGFLQFCRHGSVAAGTRVVTANLQLSAAPPQNAALAPNARFPGLRQQRPPRQPVTTSCGFGRSLPPTPSMPVGVGPARRLHFPACPGARSDVPAPIRGRELGPEPIVSRSRVGSGRLLPGAPELPEPSALWCLRVALPTRPPSRSCWPGSSRPWSRSQDWHSPPSSPSG